MKASLIPRANANASKEDEGEGWTRNDLRYDDVESARRREGGGRAGISQINVINELLDHQRD